MPKVRRSLWVVSLCLLVAAGNLPQSRGEALTVTRKVTKLRTGKRLFAPAVAELQEGDKLTLQQKEGAWMNVQFKQLVGWVHETDVSAKVDVRLSGEGVRENYSASEASAARKGFNPQVEKEYRASNPDLDAAFRVVDRIQARKIVEDQVRQFLEAGGLMKGEGR